MTGGSPLTSDKRDRSRRRRKRGRRKRRGRNSCRQDETDQSKAVLEVFADLEMSSV